MWKDIINFEGLYQITTTGKIRNKQTKKVLKPFVNNNKYLRIGLYKNGICRKYMVHVLVAKTFLENPSNLSDVNHKNNNRKDNRVINLEFVSHSDNIKQVWETGKFKKRRKSNRRINGND